MALIGRTEIRKALSSDTSCEERTGARFTVQAQTLSTQSRSHVLHRLSSGHSQGTVRSRTDAFNLLKPTGYVMHQQFNIQQLYALPTPCLCVLYLSENKQRLVPLTA